ncbi:MAG TPA: archaellin/type IV pilin N-terminal domain-containing protein [Candidatus Bathyarchaeia archaeon]
MNIKKTLQKLLKQTRGMVGIEAAIVLIAFVIVAAAFSFMVVNMGLFSTQRGRETIQNGVSEAASPLTLDGSIQIQSDGSSVNATVIPLKTLGVQYVPMSSPETEVSLRIENKTSYANIYYGIDTTTPNASTLNTLASSVVTQYGAVTAAKVFIGNSDADSSLDYDEKGFLVIILESSAQAAEREHVWLEIRPEKGAPLTIEFIVPPQLTQGWHTIGS